MSCGKHHGRHENCVCDAVEQIIKEQDAVEETTACSTSCFGNLLSPTVSGKDTIPFLLYDKKADCFQHLEMSADFQMICSASNRFSSGQKVSKIAVQRFQS